MADTIQGHEAVGGASQRGKPDPSVKLPDGVRAAAERANALAAQAKAAREATVATGGDQPVSVVVPNTQPSSTVITASFDPNNPQPPEPGDPRLSQVQSQTTPPFTPPAPPQPPQPGPEDWEHQFRSLKGRYDRDQEDKRRINQQLIETQRLLAMVNTQPQPQQFNSNEGSGVRFSGPVATPQRRVTQQEIQEYGADLMDVMGRRAQEIYETQFLPQLMGELNQVKRQIGGVQNTVVYDARVKMYDDLAKEIPNWDQINNSPQFGAWLDQIDPISRQTRRSFLNSAHNSNLTGQVVDIFKGFLADVAARSPANTQAFLPGNGAGYSQSNSGNGGSPPQVDLMQFAAPGRAKTGQTTVPPEKPIYSRADITQFYRDKTAGKYAGREAEAAALEAALFQAGNEGRIR